MTFSDRIPTGYKDRTIPNPALLGASGASRYSRQTDWGEYKNRREVYQGPVAGYNFRKQTANYEKLVAALVQHSIHFTDVSGLLYDGDRGYNQRFLVLTTHPKVMWYKYVGFIAQSGQNHLFIHGRRIKVSCFLAMKEEEQAALLSGSDSEINYYFSGKKLELIDEADCYWH